MGAWIESSPAIDSAGTIYVGSDDHKLYAIGSYTITATAGVGGSVSPTGSVYVTPGANQSYTITPSAGYHITDVLVDGTSLDVVSTYTFSNVTTNHTISASFAIKVYTLAYTAGAKSALTGTTSQSVNHGGGGTPVTRRTQRGGTTLSSGAAEAPPTPESTPT